MRSPILLPPVPLSPVLLSPVPLSPVPRSPVLLITAMTPAVWGTTYAVTIEFLPAGRPLLAGVLRALPAGLLLLALTRRLPRGSWWWRTAVLGGLNIGVFFALLFVSAYRLPGGVAAVLGAAQPLVVAALTMLLLAERVALRTAVAGLAGVTGVALTVLTNQARLDAIGVLAGLGGTVSMALGLVLTKRWGRPEVSLLTATGWQLTAGGLLLLPVALTVEGPPPAFSPGNLLGYAYLALVGTALAYSVWFWGLEQLPAARVSLLGLLSPLVATAVGWAVLGQRLTITQLAGMTLAFGAVVWGQRSAQIRILQHPAGEADAGDTKHGPTQPVRGGDMVRGYPFEQRDQRRQHGVTGVVEASFRPGAMRRLDDAGADGIAVREQLDDLPLGARLDPGPHVPAVLAGAGPRHVDEADLRVDLREQPGRGHRIVVGDRGVTGLVPAHRGDAQAVEAGVRPGQPIAHRRQVGEIGDADLAQFRMGQAGGRAVDRQHMLDVTGEQTLPQHALPDHAGRAEDHDLHRCSPSIG
jgi:probable blue pigment (indigoidine) exporter